MYSLVSGIYDSYLAPTQLNLLIVGAQDSGKTTLLERCKVTEFPAKPQKGSGNKTVHQRIAAEDLPATLKSALLETGARMGRSRRRTLSRTSLASMSRSPSTQSVQTPAPVTPAVTKGTPNVRMSTGNSVVVKQKKRFSFCPAPRRYSQAAVQDDDDDESEREVLLRDDSFSSNPPPQRRGRSHSKEFDVDTLDLITDGMESMELMAETPRVENNNRETSMSSIALDDDHPISPVTNKALQPTTPEPPQPLHKKEEGIIGPAMLQSSPQEYNVKPNGKMLPLRMIRPTIGTNLAKLDMYGAKCHIFDVGGRMKDLWERYYDDCDAVIFCWKLGEDPDKPPKEPDSDDDSDAEEEDVHEMIYKKQQDLLDTVRKSIPDDVPFLIMGHVFGKASEQIVNTMYNTDMLLPRYHNPMTGFCCSSAKTGAGVQSAMEWLIPLATRQQKERLASKRELDMMLEEQGKTV